MDLILVFEILLLVAIVAGVFLGWRPQPASEEPGRAAAHTKLPHPSA